MGWIDVLPGIRKIPSEDEIAEATERLADLLEADFPGARAFCRFTIYPSLMGWICRVDSRVQRMPAWGEASIWGSQIHVARIAKKLESQVGWFVPQAKAYELAYDILGYDGVQRILDGTYTVRSCLNRSVAYVIAPYSITLRKGNGEHRRFIGTFCLQARGRYPLWDVILSRIFMLQANERDFLQTAFFRPNEGSFFRSQQPITPQEFEAIYGKEALG